MKQIYAAFVKAQTGFAPALKTSTNPHFKSKYADLAACVEAVIDSLNANGIGLVQKTAMDESGVTVETHFVHESGETFSGGPLHVPAAKNDPQGYGSALSYARRYSLMAACGIAPEDDDGNAAKAPAKKEQPRGVMEAVKAELPALKPDEIAYYKELANEVTETFKNLGQAKAYDRVQLEQMDSEEKLHLWAYLDSKVRSGLKIESGLRMGAA